AAGGAALAGGPVLAAAVGARGRRGPLPGQGSARTAAGAAIRTGSGAAAGPRPRGHAGVGVPRGAGPGGQGVGGGGGGGGAGRGGERSGAVSEDRSYETTRMVRVPAEVNRPDPILAGLTARQLLVLGGVGVLLYAGYSATRTLLPPTVALGVGAVVAAAAFA